MNSKVLALIALLSLTGCAHTKIVGYDKQQNTVSIQGNKFASEENAQEAADEYCGHPATLLAMGERNIGSVTNANVYGNSYSASGTATTVGVTRNVYTFSCR